MDNKRLARPGNLLFNHVCNLLSELFCTKNQPGVGAVTNLGYDIQIQKLTHQTTVGLLPRHGVITQREVNSVGLPQPNSNAEAVMLYSLTTDIHQGRSPCLHGPD